MTVFVKRCEIDGMKRTQVQIPEPLYREVKRVARLRDWSVSEVFRRAAELLVAQFPELKQVSAWALPEAKDMGTPLIAPEAWRDKVAQDEES